MKIRKRNYLRKFPRALFTFIILFSFWTVLAFSSIAYGQFSNSPRQTGETVLEELLVGRTKFIVKVASNGCTDKSSFKIDVKKETGIYEKAPHYVLTIVRVIPDECKAIVDEGALIVFDLAKDLGLTGDFTYSIANRVYSEPRTSLSDESLLAIVEKYFTFELIPGLKEVKPEPYDNFVMDHDYFTCYLPASWQLKREKESDEKAGIFEVNITNPEKAKPEDGEKYYYPDPLIYIGYYTENNQPKKTYQSFIKDYEELAAKRAGSERSRYEKPKEIKFNDKEAVEIAYEVYQEEPRGPLFTNKYWLKAKFIIIKAETGFYVLAYKSPREFFNRYSPVFEEVAKMFKSLY